MYQPPDHNDYWWPSTMWAPSRLPQDQSAPWPTLYNPPVDNQTQSQSRTTHAVNPAVPNQARGARGQRRQGVARCLRATRGLNRRGYGGQDHGRNRCRAHHRICCRRCGYVPVHVRSEQLLQEIAQRISEYDGRSPTINQLKNLLNNATF